MLLHLVYQQRVSRLHFIWKPSLQRPPLTSVWALEAPILTSVHLSIGGPIGNKRDLNNTFSSWPTSRRTRISLMDQKELLPPNGEKTDLQDVWSTIWVTSQQILTGILHKQYYCFTIVSWWRNSRPKLIACQKYIKKKVLLVTSTFFVVNLSNGAKVSTFTLGPKAQGHILYFPWNKSFTLKPWSFVYQEQGVVGSDGKYHPFNLIP